ncbi:MAG: hypothetical protein NHF88_00995 [Candidatus Shikimatogenerans bostrichidophilus]|nr:MAG: hypothetical protein NHF88_00995 [Candidatus Shikimatogenerans bostrichidophilus]
MYIKIKKINIFLKNFLIYYLNKINFFYIKYNYYKIFNITYCYIYKNNFFIYIKENNFILLTNIKIYNKYNIKKIFIIKNINYFIKILIFNNNKYNILIKNKNIYITNYYDYYKLKIYKFNYKIKFNKYIIKKPKYIKINNKIFISILNKLFFNLNNKNILIKKNNLFIKIYNNIIYFISTDYNYYFLYFKFKIKSYNFNNILYKISKKSLLIYIKIFKKYKNNINILFYNKYLYINTKKTYYILKIKLINKINKFNFLINLNIKKFYYLIIDKKNILNKLIKIYNIINKNNIINFIELKILKRKIILSYKNKFINLKNIIKNFTYKGKKIKLIINLYLFIKLLLILNNKYIYINKKNIFIKKKINNKILFMGLITNIKN